MFAAFQLSMCRLTLPMSPADIPSPAAEQLICVQVYALVDHEGSGVNVQVHKVLTGQDQPNGVAWHKNSLYVAEVGQITRYDNPDASALVGKVRNVRVCRRSVSALHCSSTLIASVQNDSG